jgi:hypothetical protein
MISLKRYLDRTAEQMGNDPPDEFPGNAILEVYVAVLIQMCESGACACPAREKELRPSHDASRRKASTGPDVGCCGRF